MFLQVANAELGYRLTPPDGFMPYAEGRAQKDIVDCWIEATPASANGSIVFCVQRMRGTLGRERMKREDLPASVELTTFKWKGFDIDGVRSAHEESGDPVVVILAQVPLRPEAIQLIASGPADQEARVHALMTSTLLTVEGKTNWLSRTERAERLGNIVGLALGVVVALVGIRIWRARRRSRSA
jgi:hypothetical protein